MTQTLQLTDELLQAALEARMRHAPSAALFDRIVATAATARQERRPGWWLGSRSGRVRLELPALAGVVVAALAFTLLFAVLRPTNLQPGASPTPSATGKGGPAETPQSRLLGDSQALRLRFGGDTAPLDVIDAFGSIWTADIHAAAVSRVDPDSLQEVARIPVPSGPAWFVVAQNELWVTDQTGAGIVRIDQASNTASTRVGNAPPCGAPASTGGEIWLSACDADAFLRIDPIGGAVVDTIPAGGHRGIVASGDRLVTIGGEGLAVVDPSKRSFTRIGSGVGRGGTLLGGDAGSVWVALNLSVERIDPGNGKVLASFPYLGAQAIDIAGDHAWLTVDNRGILEIDLRTDTLTRTIPLLPSPQVPREAFGALWVTDFNNSDLWRIQP